MFRNEAKQMKLRFQFGGLAIAAMLASGFALPADAQRDRNKVSQDRQAQKPPKQQQPKEKQRQEQRQERREERRNSARPPAPTERFPNANRPPERARNQQPNPNRPPENGKDNFARQNRPRYTPEEQKRLADNNARLRKLTPEQRRQVDDRLRVWQKMTPDQRQHVRQDVLPKWQQMPPDRKQAIQQKLRVLQNMPESARNQRLADPNFTRGMSDEDRSMLHDLSHLHVGGAPDAPNE